MNICDSCKKTECELQAGFGPMKVCGIHHPITRADLAARDADVDRLVGVILEMHDAARGEIFTRGIDGAGSWAKTVNALGFSPRAKRHQTATEGAKP